MKPAVRQCCHWLLALGVLTGSVPALYAAAAGCFPAPAGLVGWWPGDGNTNDIASTNNGTLQGGATANAVGMVAQAFSFDGTNNYVQIPDAPALKPTNLTIEAWVNFSGLNSALSGTAPAGDQYIVFKQNSQPYYFEGYSLEKFRVANGDAFMFTVGSGSGQAVVLLSATLVSTSVWYHVAAVRGSNFMQLYINGQLESQTNVSFAQDYGTLPLYFGTSHETYWDGKLRGLLDEVSLYNRALSANEVAAIYAAGAAGKCKGASLVTQPQSQTVVAGSNALFTVTAAGVGLLSYQWQFNGASIAAASSTSLVLTNVQTTNAGSYTVVVTNSLGSTTSTAAVLTVWVRPAITSQPQSRTNVLGTDASFNVTAFGTPAPACQWQLNGADIPGATGTNLLRSAVSFSDAGGYGVVLTNAAGAVTSAVATLTVVCPSLILNPASLPSGTAGIAYSQSLGATGGAAPYSYSVTSGSLPRGLVLSGGGVLSGTPAAVGSFSFTARAADTNGCGGTNGYTLAIGCPAITVGPAALSSGLVGNAYNQILTASGGVGPYTFAVIAGSLPAGLGLSGAGVLNGIPAAIGTNIFTVTATDTNGCPGSQSCILAVTGAPPVITLQPQSRTNIIGTDATFNVTASGVPFPACQWQFNGAAIPGATGTTLLRSAVSFADVGEYRVVLTNLAGVVTSGVAVLTVVCPAITVGPATLSSGIVGTGYSQSLTAGGGLGPCTFAVTAGTLPAGLSLSGAGVLSGMPTAIGTNNFTVAATDTNGCSGSQVCSLTVSSNNTVGGSGPPVIISAPSSQTNNAGTTAAFSVGASGAWPLSYQWQFNGANIAGATSTSLILNYVQPANAGSYTVVVTNSAGTATSAAGVLTVLPSPGTVLINGAQTYQVIDGFGVNANSGSWTNNDLQPVLDALIQAGMKLFLAEFVGNCDWEATNANPGASLTNWTYFNSVYSGPNFQQLWGMMAYLNQRGITNGLMPKFTGPTALWMGGQSLTPGYEIDYAKMLASALIYARQTQNLQFTVVPPLNEPDIAQETGVRLRGASQYVTVVDDLGQQLDANGMSDVRFSGPELATTSTSWMGTMMTNSYLMSKLAHFGLHSYAGVTPDESGLYGFIQQSAYPNTHFWMTEFSVSCPVCLSGPGGNGSWPNAQGIASALINHLANGASAGLAFDAYDCVYNSYDPNTGQDLPGHWISWGLFAVDNTNAANKTYTPRKQFYTVSQITKYVRPGAIRIDVGGASTPLTVLAFCNTNNGQFTLTGVSTSSSATTLSCALMSLPAITSLDLYYTSSTTNLCYGGSVALTNDAFSVAVPANCVFTLTVTCPTVTLNPASLPSGTAGLSYSQSLSASGGLAPYTFAVTAGTLPAGLSLSGAGVLSGTPSGIGTNSFTVTATDINGCPGSQALTLAVTGAPPVITLHPQSLTNIIGTDASFSVTASGAPLPAYQWQFNGAAIPGATGTNLLQDAVSFADAGGYGVVVTNAVGAVTSAVATLTVVCPSLTLNPATLSSGIVGTAYGQSLTASGGLGPYSFAVTAGMLPAGLSLSDAGVLGGTPSGIGTNSFTVTATDTNGCPGSQACSVAIFGIPRPGIVSISLSGTNLVVNGNNGLSGRTYYVLMSTNAALPLSQWVPVATNLLIGSGSFTLTATNAVSPAAPQRFYILQVQ